MASAQRPNTPLSKPGEGTTPRRDFAAFDALPREVREAVRNARTNVSAESVLGTYRRAMAANASLAQFMEWLHGELSGERTQ